MENKEKQALETKIEQLDQKISLLLEQAGLSDKAPQVTNSVQDDVLQSMQDKVRKLISESKDPYFTKYLWSVKEKIQTEEENIRQIEAGLNRNVEVYHQRLSGMDGAKAQTTVAMPQETPVTAVFSEPERQPISAQVVSSTQTTPAQAVSTPATLTSPVQPVSVQATPVQASHTSMEFKVGAGVLGAIGIFFLLSAFVMFGMSFMGGMVKGISLFVISLAVLLLSECVLRKKQEKFSRSITALGICGLYVSTIINYLYLHNFNGIVAITLTVLIAVTALFLSRKRESTIIRVIGFLGCYTCLYPIGGPIQEANFLVLTIILFIINGMTVLLPVKKNEKAIVVLHTCAHVVFTIALLVVGLLSRINEPYLYIFLASSVMILNAVFMGVEMTAGMVAVFCGGLFAESLLYFGLAEDCVQIWMAPVTLLPVCLLFFFINRKKPIKWIQYWFFLLVMYYQYGIGYWNEGWTPTICVLAIFASAKLLSRIYYLKTSEVIITSVTMLIAVGNILSGNVAEGACFAGAFLLSVAALKYWRTLYECMITVVVALFLWMNVDFPLNLAICVGLLLLGILAFNHIKWWRGAKVTVYNYGSLAVMCLLYLGLAAVDNYLIYFIMLLFGISTIILVLQNKYGVNFKHKHMIMAVFLTYMAFICKIELPIVISVILLVIAIGSVASGFYHKEKQMRIYGLILSLFACAKVLLFDFYGAATLQKTILFFIMGSIVLAISYIYIRLEKSMDKTDSEEMKG